MDNNMRYFLIPSLPISSIITTECMNAIANFLFSTLGTQMNHICPSSLQGCSPSVFQLDWNIHGSRPVIITEKIHQYYKAHGTIAMNANLQSKWLKYWLDFQQRQWASLDACHLRAQLAGCTADRRGCWKGARFLTYMLWNERDTARCLW